MVQELAPDADACRCGFVVCVWRTGGDEFWWEYAAVCVQIVEPRCAEDGVSWCRVGRFDGCAELGELLFAYVYFGSVQWAGSL